MTETLVACSSVFIVDFKKLLAHRANDLSKIRTELFLKLTALKIHKYTI